MMAASASARMCTEWASTSSGLDSAFTRSNVWNVETRGRSSWCLMVCPAMPLSQ